MLLSLLLAGFSSIFSCGYGGILMINTTRSAASGGFEEIDSKHIESTEEEEAQEFHHDSYFSESYEEFK
ncbi:unnamed protein product, partial [Mesorhabditis spiculigera]